MRNHIAIIHHRIQLYAHNSIDFGAIVGCKHLDIVSREARHHTTFGRAFEQHLGLLPDMTLAELAVELLTQFVKTFGSFG